MPFQLIEVEVDKDGNTIERKGLHPLFENRDEARVMAERAAMSHLDAHGYDAQHDYWWGRDQKGRVFHFFVEGVEA